MAGFSRRDFLFGSAALAGAAAIGVGPSLAAPAGPIKASDVVTLGRSGVKTSILGLGTGTRGGSEQRAMGSDAFTKMVRGALERGIRFIETAHSYNMHVDVQRALEGVPRDQYTLLTKTRARMPELVEWDINTFRHELNQGSGSGYFDMVLMHCMTAKNWPTDYRPVRDKLLEFKKKGLIRAVGVSCHGWDALVASAMHEACDDLDVHLVRVNPFGHKMDGKPEDVVKQIERIKAKGRGVLGMKIYGENGLESREQRVQSIKYALDNGVDAFTIGFSDIKQIEETMQLVEEASAGG